MQLYDQVIPFQLGNIPIRGRILILENAINTILGKHIYPEIVGSLLAESLVFVGLMGASLKSEGFFTLQIRGDGPIKLLVADATQAGITRGYAEFDADRIAQFSVKDMPSLPSLLGKGQLALTLDQQEMKERYQGLVSLEGATLSESLHHYFKQSEQLNTALFLCAQQKDNDWRAGGLFLQLMPESQNDDDNKREDDWLLAMQLLSTIRKTELLSGLTPHDILFRLFHEEGIKVFDPSPIKAGCRCNRERITTFLNQIQKDDRKEFVIDNKIVVTCQFCNSHYEFDPEEFS